MRSGEALRADGAAAGDGSRSWTSAQGGFSFHSILDSLIANSVTIPRSSRILYILGFSCRHAAWSARGVRPRLCVDACRVVLSCVHALSFGLLWVVPFTIAGCLGSLVLGQFS